MYRILKPNGKVLIADTFKPYSYSIDDEKAMQMMLNGWAISDILSVDELKQITQNNGFELVKVNNATKQVKKSVSKLYTAGVLGMFGSELYNFFKNARYFSRKHYKTCIAQKKAYDKGQWGYYLFAFEKK